MGCQGFQSCIASVHFWTVPVIIRENGDLAGVGISDVWRSFILAAAKILHIFCDIHHRYPVFDVSGQAQLTSGHLRYGQHLSVPVDRLEQMLGTNYHVYKHSATKTTIIQTIGYSLPSIPHGPEAFIPALVTPIAILHPGSNLTFFGVARQIYPPYEQPLPQQLLRKCASQSRQHLPYVPISLPGTLVSCGWTRYLPSSCYRIISIFRTRNSLLLAMVSGNG